MAGSSERTAARVAVIDDDRHVQQTLSLHLKRRGYEVADAADGLAGLRLVRTLQPDIVILDVLIPKLNGLELLPHLRRLTQAPIILLSAKDDVEMRIAAFGAGADDYVPKPFDVGELLARVATRLRRTALDQAEVLSGGDIEVDLRRQTVRRGGRVIPVSTLEYKLLVAFLRNKNQILSRDQLLDLVWGNDIDATPSAAERYVSYLRAKLDAGRGEVLIRTVRGAGYVLDG